MKLTETNVRDGFDASHTELSRNLFEDLAREVGVEVEQDEPYSDAPSKVFRGLAFAMVVSAILWLAVIAVVLTVL
ncbi:hypothetical protein ACFSGX_17295 [Sphingomonas arantia]|uniref:Uncharacterized protein n=1 Tax=Sphingomonas arantia TaxID=1460676 RepID=A0ABW4U2H0_9SPHN